MTNKEKELIRRTYQRLEYLADARCRVKELQQALRWYMHDRDISRTEGKMVLLNWLDLYETRLSKLPASELLGYDIGLLQLAKLYEEIRGVSGFDRLQDGLLEVHRLYKTWQEDGKPRVA